MAGSSDYPGRLRHDVPDWVDRSSAVYHLRIGAEPDCLRLTDPQTAPGLIAAAMKYAELGWWWPRLFLLMPDHIHAITSFHPDKALARIVGDWKAYQTRTLGVAWQENFFDHRFRNEESIEEKWHYIRANPVRAELCPTEDDWPWWFGSLDLDPSA